MRCFAFQPPATDPFSLMKDGLFHHWCTKAKSPVSLFPLMLTMSLSGQRFEILVKTTFRTREKRICEYSSLGEQKMSTMFGDK